MPRIDMYQAMVDAWSAIYKNDDLRYGLRDDKRQLLRGVLDDLTCFPDPSNRALRFIELYATFTMKARLIGISLRLGEKK